MTRELIEQLDAEHEQLASALQVAGDSIARLRRSASRADASAALDAFTRLQEVVVGHFDHEEAEIEPIYLAKRDDPAIRAMGRQFARISPRVAGTFFAWVMDGASPAETEAIKGGIPAPILLVLRGLYGRTYRRTVAPAWQ